MLVIFQKFHSSQNFVVPNVKSHDDKQNKPYAHFAYLSFWRDENKNLITWNIVLFFKFWTMYSFCISFERKVCKKCIFLISFIVVWSHHWHHQIFPIKNVLKIIDKMLNFIYLMLFQISILVTLFSRSRLSIYFTRLSSV